MQDYLQMAGRILEEELQATGFDPSIDDFATRQLKKAEAYKNAADRIAGTFAMRTITPEVEGI